MVGAKTMDLREELAHNLKIDDRVAFRCQPLKTGTAMNVNLFIEGVKHVAHGVEWHTSFTFSPVDTFTPWIWGTGLWGTTTLWG